ncbi:DUF5753 domain-containing protein [Streptomyces sp. OR43]|uniref:DUF5753 domain-containing protein n=1 Tax=Streptomyces sp. or43 TaxID=2478957 RepID=UPI0021C5960B|nr:DUF5753 domain-containing protein [Streptomyces sp. or43]
MPCRSRRTWTRTPIPAPSRCRVTPRLLQTERYARALTRAAHPYATTKVVEGHVTARMERAQLLDSPSAPVLWAMIHGAALPFSAGAHPFLHASMLLMQFTDSPAVVYTESAYSGQLVEEPLLVEQYGAAYDWARAAALSPEASLRRIVPAAKEFATP